MVCVQCLWISALRVEIYTVSNCIHLRANIRENEKDSFLLPNTGRGEIAGQT